ncbi:MAG: hypothetical protein AAF456_08845 [Planctomycetota bacterium]
MSKWVMIATFFCLGLIATPAMAQDGASGILLAQEGIKGIAAIGAGLALIEGAGFFAIIVALLQG